MACIQRVKNLIGRELELQQIGSCLRARQNVLIEGPVGVGKTTLALEICRSLGIEVFRIDGDARFTEQKLTGWFDPATVLAKGYTSETFVDGPLVKAMRSGGVLLLNEMNRLPDGVQNILLPALDEREISIPHLGRLKAPDSFRVIATQNPREFVATTHLSEALLDRFELIRLNYQSEEEEKQIVLAHTPQSKFREAAVKFAVRVTRATREHPQIRRGASVRAAISIAQLVCEMTNSGTSLDQALIDSVAIALPTRVEWARELESETHRREIFDQLTESNSDSKKKVK